MEARNVTWRRKIHRVPILLRQKKQQQRYTYDPWCLSIGPYHHGEANLRRMEEFKREIATMFVISGSGGELKEMETYYTEILKRINKIRSCYVGVTVHKYDDATLSEIILHDSCFIIYVIMAVVKEGDANRHFAEHLGVNGPFYAGELNFLENQIPYWVIKLLITLKFGESKGKSILCTYFSFVTFGTADKLTRLPWKDDFYEEEPLHLLEASQRILAMQEQDHEPKEGWKHIIFPWLKKKIDKIRGKKSKDIKIFSDQFYSITALKEKGIIIKPSSTCLRDVGFKSHAIYGELQLPIFSVNSYSNVYLQNMIAFEMSAGSNNKLVVTSYINFLKAVIKTPADVRELFEKKILLFCFWTGMDVVNLFQGIDAMIGEDDLFYGLKVAIHEHCSRKAKTWMVGFLRTSCGPLWLLIVLLNIISLILNFYPYNSAALSAATSVHAVDNLT